ncbi:hypothetical protein AB0F52_15155 [Amycolatopsis sp. NPDC024027]|uniref:hypothetical protein n=1 Tax=Amycolatopsis sp. NPDC024027 TaxID=3154327 RepID=UPI0033D0BAB1
MDETDLLITQMGLLLTQTRFARRALEDIERAVSAYAGFAFTSVIAAGPRFGAPPLFEGALKVHVVNISDLAPGGGFGDFLKGLLGGVGAFLGNLPGGFVGGLLSSHKLVEAIPEIHLLAVRIDSILTKLGMGQPAGDKKHVDQRGGSVPGPTIPAQLDSIRTAVDALTGLFLAAGGEPDKAAKVSTLPSTPEGERWTKLLDSSSVVLSGIARVVDGLIIALPIAIGSIAWLIDRLGGIRSAIAETLRFALRNALLLRGTIVVIAFDTVAMIARTAAAVIGILAGTLDGMLSAIFDTIREALLAAFQLGAVLGEVVKSTVDKLLDWLVPTVDRILRNLADLRAFRVLVHVIRVLPAILPPIYLLVKEVEMPKEQADALKEASKLEFLAPAIAGAGGATGLVPPALDLKPVFTDPALIGRATAALDRIQQVAADGLRITGDEAQRGLRGLGGMLDRAAADQVKLSDKSLASLLGTVRTQSTELANNLVVGEKTKSDTGLDGIAAKYEEWLTDGGLSTLLTTITAHFTTPAGAAGVPRRVTEGTFDTPRATIQIDEVIIEVGRESDLEKKRPDGFSPPGDYPGSADLDEIERLARLQFDRDYRLGRVGRPIHG